jgi:hypothetical protein
MSNNLIVHETGIGFDPRVIYESLGSKIIESDSIAIAEQIKNATDAGATNISVDFSNLKENLIEIIDDGSGMTIDEIKENWFFVASSNKNNKLSQLGGKGIGRFSLFRIANIIEIETVSNGIKCEFKLVKKELEDEEKLSDFKIRINESNTREKNGTKIKLRDINSIDLVEIQRELENFSLPESKKTFEVIYPDDLEMINYFAPEKCVSEAPFYAKIQFEGNKILSYNFSCNYKGQNIYINNNISPIQTKISEINPWFNLGNTTVLIYNYFFDNKVGNVTKEREKSIKEHFLSAYQGISVYRNNYKIYGHGENDWLKLAEKRLKRASENIDNKLTFGYITLDSEKSLSLEEKTNREGFIKNKVSIYFREIMELIVLQFGIDRKESVKIIRALDKSTGSKEHSETGTSGTDSGGTGTSGTGSGGTGTSGTGSGGTGTSGTGSGGTGTSGTGSGGTGTSGTGFGGTGTSGTGSGGTGTSGTDSGGTGNRFTKSSYIGAIDPEIKRNINSPKVASLVNEITTIYIERHTLATGFLLRSLTEVMMDEYLRINLTTIQAHFKDYIVDTNNNIKKSYYNSKTNSNDDKDVSIKAKLMDFKKYLGSTNKFDNRSLKHLDYLATCIDDINLAMHWTHKTVGTDQLRTNWQNSLFFIEFICKSI